MEYKLERRRNLHRDVHGLHAVPSVCGVHLVQLLSHSGRVPTVPPTQRHSSTVIASLPTENLFTLLCSAMLETAKSLLPGVREVAMLAIVFFLTFSAFLYSRLRPPGPRSGHARPRTMHCCLLHGLRR